MKINFFIFSFISFCLSLNLTCERSEFESVINKIIKHGSNFRLTSNLDTIYSSEIINYSDEILTINLLNQKWSNYSIGRNFANDNSFGSSSPFSIHVNKINCIEELEKPNYIKEYSILMIISISIWSILTVFSLL
tara:strand:+ start:364 stop:768 length:405 start_codon:yes stop_codon:yes gene_type:complete